MEKVTTSFLFEIEDSEKQNPKMLRIVLTDKHTRIDFGYTAPWHYKNGGWIKISPKTYLKTNNTHKKYSLLEAEGIAIAPNRIDFQSKADWQFFSLYFEPIPNEDCILDMIESENPTENDFNYYGVELNSKKGLELV
jgi:hypothetical protein